MNKEGTQADRPSILLARRKEDKGAICMDGKAQPGQARTGWAGLGWARGRGLPMGGVRRY